MAQIDDDIVTVTSVVATSGYHTVLEPWKRICAFVKEAQAASTNIAMPKPEDIIGACSGCKHDLPNGSGYCESCCRCESLSDNYEFPASA